MQRPETGVQNCRHRQGQPHMTQISEGRGHDRNRLGDSGSYPKPDSVACLKAPASALLIALRINQDKGQDIASAGFAVVTVLRSVCAKTRHRMPDRNGTVPGTGIRQVVPRVILRVTYRLIPRITRRFPPRVNRRLTRRFTLRFTQGLSLLLIG